MRGFAVAMGLTLGMPVAVAAEPAQGGAAFMTLGMEAEAPRGFVEMCRTEATFCARSTDQPQGDGALVTSAIIPSPMIWPNARTGLRKNISLSVMAVSASPQTGSSYATIGDSLVNRVPPLAMPSYFDIARHNGNMPGAASLPTPAGPAIGSGPVAASADARLLESPVPAEGSPEAHAEMELLKRVNRHVNEHVVQRTDMEVYGRAEVWRRSGVDRGAAGDCEDIAIEKRFELIGEGFDARRMYFAVVYLPEAGLHTVLVARTAAGDLVLDSRTPYIERWDRTSYSWISVQSTVHPMEWFALGALPDRVASTRQGIGPLS